MLNQFFYGVIFVACCAIGLFFLKFWRKSGDSLFLMFALAFGLLGVERLVITFIASGSEFKVYLIRLAAFILILAGIIQKNRSKKK